MQEMHEVLTNQLENLEGNTNLQEHAKLASEQLSAMLEHLRHSQKVKFLVEQLQAVMMAPSVDHQDFQEHAKALSERLQAIVIDPDLQKHWALFVERLDAVITNPKVREQAQLASEHLKAL